MIDFALLIFGAFVAMLFFSRIFRWLLSYLVKGTTLSVVSDLLTGVALTSLYVYNSDAQGRDAEREIVRAIIGYGIGGLVVLVLDLYFDARAAAKGESR